MTSATQTLGGSFWADADADGNSTTGPERRRMRSPVFIGDALTPWGGETLLLAMLRAQALELEDDANP